MERKRVRWGNQVRENSGIDTKRQRLNKFHRDMAILLENLIRSKRLPHPKIVSKPPIYTFTTKTITTKAPNWRISRRWNRHLFTVDAILYGTSQEACWSGLKGETTGIHLPQSLHCSLVNYNYLAVEWTRCCYSWRVGDNAPVDKLVLCLLGVGQNGEISRRRVVVQLEKKLKERDKL